MTNNLLTNELINSVNLIFQRSLAELVAKALWDKGIRRADLIKLGLHSEYLFSNVGNCLDRWEKGFGWPDEVPQVIHLP